LRHDESLFTSSAVAEMGDRGHNRHGSKIGGGAAVPLSRELGRCPVQCGLGRGLFPYYNVAWAEFYFRTKRHLHLSSHLATIDMGQKLDGGGCAFFSGGSWVHIGHSVS